MNCQSQFSSIHKNNLIIQAGSRPGRVVVKIVLIWISVLVLALASMSASASTLLHQNGEEEWVLDGLIQIDVVDFSADLRPVADDAAFRRAEFSVRWKRPGRAEFVLGYDPFVRKWLDGYGQWHFSDKSQLRVGQFKQGLNLEDLSATKHIDFTARALPNAFAIGRRLGIEYRYGDERLMASIAGYGREANADGAHGAGMVTRITAAPIRRDGRILHLGLAMAAQHANQGGARFSTRPEVDLADARLVDTGRIDQAKSHRRVGLELAYLQGPWMLQGESIQDRLDRDGSLNSLDFSGAYLAGTWFITGEQRSYADGKFGVPEPLRSGVGAVELALRHSMIDLDDAEIRGGRERNWTFGVNWYLRRHLKLAIDYTAVRSTRAGLRDDPKAVTARVQYTF